MNFFSSSEARDVDVALPRSPGDLGTPRGKLGAILKAREAGLGDVSRLVFAWQAFVGYNSCRKELRDDAMKLIVTLERDEKGKTEEQALANIRGAIAACVETRVANGM